MSKYNIGDKINFLTIIDKPERGKWLCKCDCGTIKLLLASCVRDKKTKSCGCYNSKLASERWKKRHKNGHFLSKPKPSKLIIYDFWSILLNQAKRRNIEFDLKPQYLDKIFLKQKKKCVYTDLSLTLPINCYERRNGLYNASLDRIDNSKGYVEGNVQWVHKRINMMKHSMSEDDFITICNMVAKKHKSSNNEIDDSFKMNKGGAT